MEPEKKDKKSMLEHIRELMMGTPTVEIDAPEAKKGESDEEKKRREEIERNKRELKNLMGM